MFWCWTRCTDTVHHVFQSLLVYGCRWLSLDLSLETWCHGCCHHWALCHPSSRRQWWQDHQWRCRWGWRQEWQHCSTGRQFHLTKWPGLYNIVRQAISYWKNISSEVCCIGTSVTGMSVNTANRYVVWNMHRDLRACRVCPTHVLQATLPHQETSVAHNSV